MTINFTASQSKKRMNILLKYIYFTARDSSSETRLYAAHLVTLAPCDCNITVNVCDWNCCCDTDCSNTTRNELFNCSSAR